MVGCRCFNIEFKDISIFFYTIDIKTFAISDGKGNPIDSPVGINKPQITGRKSFNDMMH